MSNEPEAQQDDGEVYNDHSVDNSIHHAVNLWPLPVLGIIVSTLILLLVFAPDIKHKTDLIPWGKAYHATGAVILCQPFQPYGNGPFRTLIRTPQDSIFEVAFREGQQPPGFANAIGEIAYHECGRDAGRVVHCFDSFKFLHQGVLPLDINGKPVETPTPQKK